MVGGIKSRPTRRDAQVIYGKEALTWCDEA